jgi:hypothetical protein
LDIKFRLSQKPKLLNETIPARARELAERLTGLAEPLFKTHESRPEDKFLAPPGAWNLELQTVFRSALELVVQLRQRDDRTDFIWPGYGSVFDKTTMKTSANLTKDELEGKKVQLTLAPAAIGWLANQEETEEREMEVYQKATVILDLKPSSSSGR